jgi:hypothetical protein
VTALARSVASRVEELRGLRFQRPVPATLVDAAATRAYLQEQIERSGDGERAHMEQIAYAQLGLLPSDRDLLADMLDLLDEQLLAYYDPEAQALFVRDILPAASGAMIVAHELTHALDDQHLGLQRMLESPEGDDDRALAARAVVEGSGTLVMTRFLVEEIRATRLPFSALGDLAKAEGSRTARLAEAPPILQRTLIAPYLLGQVFLLRGNPLGLVQGVPAADLAEAFAHPPTSTEQLIHPEKYWGPGPREETPPVAPGDLSAVLGPGFALAYEGTLGELGLAVLGGLGPVDVADPAVALPGAWTNPVGAGWGGDRLQLYVRGEERVTLLVTRWDTLEDAAEFVRAMGDPHREILVRDREVAVVAGDLPARRATLGKAALRPR